MEDFNYDQIYDMISKMNKSVKEKCLICHFPIDEKELELVCKHQYHFKCIDKKNYKLICPYCGKLNKTNTINENNCKYKILNGINKGNICGRLNCKYHKTILISDKHIIEATDLDVCQTILKSGIKKGQICGRIDCKYHQINL